MEVRRSTPAVEDLERILQHIEKDNPTAARDVVKTIYDGCTALKDFPPGDAPDAWQDGANCCFPPCLTLPSTRSRTPLKSPASTTGRKTGLSPP